MNARSRGFTLLELLIVLGIMILLTALVVPTVTSRKSADDLTKAANTIKGVLEQARTYTVANNTYTWVGFYEENVSSPSSPNSTTPPVGRVIMATVASKDRTVIYDPSSPAQIPTTSLVPVGKLTKIDNVHLWTHTDTPSTPAGSTFATRPNVAPSYCIGDTSPPASSTYFQYPVGNPAPTPQYTFLKAIQFGPDGGARINNDVYSPQPQTVVEIALEPTHGPVAPVPSPIPSNVVAIQVTGLGGDITVYRQ